VYHSDYGHAIPGTPLDPRRAERILAFLTEEGLIEEGDLQLPRPPPLRDLLLAHSADYLASLEQTEAVARILGAQVDDEELVAMLDVMRLMVGGTIHATRLALRNRGIAVNLGGGFHHAHRDSGMGFCVFNDVAVAITRLRARGFKQPILVIDLDLHDGNGTRAIFADDPTVYTYSIHNQHWGETAAVASTAIALGDDVSDEVYLGSLLKSFPEVLDEFRPGLVIYLAGTDPAASDRIGNWKVTARGMLSRDRYVIDELRHRFGRLPIVVLLAGGYGRSTWRYSARFMSWLLTGRAVEPPGNEELTVMRFRRLMSRVDPALLTAEPGELELRFSEEDLLGIVPGMPRRTRFLRYFSRHGVELLLERFGILDRVRVLGYKRPLVELDLSHPVGETLRILGGGPDELLVELRVNRSHRAIENREVLVIEWLLLQNPRAEFGPYRRPLPGQKHPGLGLLKDLFGWLVVVCENLKLDAIYYLPSHFHVAAQSRRLVRFLHPEHEALMRVLEQTLGEMSLPAASRAMSEGRLLDGSSGRVFEWQGYPMVLPVSEGLKEVVFSDAYEEAVMAAMPAINMRLQDQDAVAS
jgi:acetoin utilization deacetylase AcuC-like enzyme